MNQNKQDIKNVEDVSHRTSTPGTLAKGKPADKDGGGDPLTAAREPTVGTGMDGSGDTHTPRASSPPGWSNKEKCHFGSPFDLQSDEDKDVL